MEEKIKDLKIGQVLYYAFEDRPIDGYGISKCIIKEICDDHMLLEDQYSTLWIDYEEYFGEKDGSIGVFDTEKEAKDWLGI